MRTFFISLLATLTALIIFETYVNYFSELEEERSETQTTELIEDFR